MAVLAVVFCADTYTQEITGKRSEIQRLYPMKKRIGSICRRIVIQELFLFSLGAIGYGLFSIFQNPIVLNIGESNSGNGISLFFTYLFAIIITNVFWGLLSNLFSCLARNMWVGIGACLILWMVTNSSVGDKYLGARNLFSYTFRNVENSSDFSWIYGKVVCIGMAILVTVILPEVIKKRG